jgi:hypothetical protein
MHSFVDTIDSIGNETLEAVLGPVECFYCSPSHCVALHNKLIRMLKRALNYIQLGFDIPISNAVKEMFLGVKLNK